jgi:hypothetical protein
MSKAPPSADEVFRQALRFDYSRIFLVLQAQHWQSASDSVSTERGLHFSLSPEAMPPTLVSAAVCGAFSTELYLKSILLLEGQPMLWIHDLGKLFRALPRAWQDRLENAYARELTHNEYQQDWQGLPPTILANLESGASVFVEWRYMFEAGPTAFWLDPARNAILRELCEFKPEWEHMRVNIDSPPQPPSRG